MVQNRPRIFASSNFKKLIQDLAALDLIRNDLRLPSETGIKNLPSNSGDTDLVPDREDPICPGTTKPVHPPTTEPVL